MKPEAFATALSLIATFALMSVNAPTFASETTATGAATTPMADTASPTAAPTKTAATADKPQIDPGARALLEQSQAAYEALTAYADVVELSSTVNGTTKPMVKASIAYQKPNRFSYRVTRFAMAPAAGNPVSMQSDAVFDGKTYFVLPMEDQKHYFNRNTPTPPDTAFMDSGAMFLEGTRFLVMPKSISQMFEMPRPGMITWRMVSLRTGPAGEVEGTPVDTVTAVQTLSERDSTFEQTETYEFGQSDHLIRRLTRSIRKLGAPDKPGVVSEQVETHHQIQTPAKLPEMAFAYVPPSGVTLGTEAQYGKLLYDRQHPRYFDPKLVVGGRPRPFTASTVDGKTVRLADYKGKVVLLDFWATWCGPCCQEIPNVVNVYGKYHAKGLNILSISLDSDKQALTDYLGPHHITWPQVFDGQSWNSSVGNLYQVRAIPFMLLIDRKGKIASVNPRGEALEPAVRKALAD